MSNLKTVREALFKQLTALSQPDLQENQIKLNNVIDQANAVKNVCDSIIDSAKLEHNFMKQTERILPYTDFMGDEVGDRVHSIGYYARIAAEKKKNATLRLLGREDDSVQQTG